MKKKNIYKTRMQMEDGFLICTAVPVCSTLDKRTKTLKRGIKNKKGVSKVTARRWGTA